MSDALDTHLSMPLEEPADMGFSARVMNAIADQRLRQAKREAILSLIAVALALLVAALSPVGPALAQVAEILAGTPAVWLAAFMILGSGVLYSRIRA